MSSAVHTAPPDQLQREQALDPTRSVLVRAPAGSGKTDLLTRRFLRLLSEVDDPSQIVAITFTKAAAAEMRHRILSELERAGRADDPAPQDAFSMQALAERALARSQQRGWNLVELPSQLRISTIDSFCRDLALQEPLLSGFGGSLDISDDPDDLYRRAATQTLQQLGSVNAEAAELRRAIETLLLWRDNNWQELESLLIRMLQQRDRWMHDFVLSRDPDWEDLRERLERPFVRAVATAIERLDQVLAAHPDACREAHELARFACAQKELHRDLAELADFPCGPFTTAEEIEEARLAFGCLADMLLTDEGSFRKPRGITVSHGFPADRKREKQRMLDLLSLMSGVPELQGSLDAIRCAPPARYTDEDWQILRACFTLLRHAAGILKVIFAEAGVVDFIEIAQLAQRVLQGPDGLPTDAALFIADGIHHLLVDEFQDTSRRQHRLIGTIAGAWPDSQGRTVFVVGDPMQSIYFFRDADAELFPRVQNAGLEVPNNEPLALHYVPLASNFRTAPQLVESLNHAFGRVFATQDGSQIEFSPAQPARSKSSVLSFPRLRLHLEFIRQAARANSSSPEAIRDRELCIEERSAAHQKQIAEIVALIDGHSAPMQEAQVRGDKYRVSVLGRTKASLAPIAAALRDAGIRFRAVELEPLAARPEILDALALARSLFYPEDRVSWLGVLRAPWSGLSLEDLHRAVSQDDPALLRRPVPELLRERVHLLSADGQQTVNRVLMAIDSASTLRAALPTASLGTWLQQVWAALGGEACVDANARANLDLLWECLDALPGGEPALLGPSLVAALADLTALADPSVTSERGVQLMTIHKSKGLEFEVVIVPELQAQCARTRHQFLSWLERGLATPDESGETTEFLVAPLPRRGTERGKAKAWVDHEIASRESQEMRRILYVAATRAREELHLFTRPAYTLDDEDQPSLCLPNNSLLATAWPAFEAEIQQAFENWRTQRASGDVELAAGAAEEPGHVPSARPAVLHRLPRDFESAQAALVPRPRVLAPDPAQRPAYARHEGGSDSRARGIAVHAFFEELARNRDVSIEAVLRAIEPRVTTTIRGLGLPRDRAAEIASQARTIALTASNDEVAQWILAPHPEAENEVRWVGVIDGVLRTVQVDRVFRAAAQPGKAGDEAWWVIDYKTAHRDGIDPAEAIHELRAQFAPQLELYAKVLRAMRGSALPIRLGIYYPLLRQFDHWDARPASES